MLKFLSLLFLVSCAIRNPSPVRGPSSLGAYNSWQSYVEEVVFRRDGLNKFYTDSKFLDEWRENPDFVMNKVPPRPNQIQEQNFSCHSDKVWPSHPTQYTKDYMWAVYAHYGQDLPPKSYACQIKSPTGKFCLRSSSAIAAVISDVFEDECGNLYRGYWLVTYLKSDESMGTLLSKGRTVYPRPGSEFAGDYVEGDTYFSKPSDFLFFGSLMSGDTEKVKQERARAVKMGYKRVGKKFQK